MTGGKRIVRADVKPGMIVEHRVRFVLALQAGAKRRKRQPGV